MTTYNFSEISDFEFEALCRDLLQEELGLSLELFSPGPDGGIDIRYIGSIENEANVIVAQCKRWAANSFPKLLRHLSKEELPKIRKLTPQRYIVMTSVELTPGRKEKIAKALKPWIHTSSDVMGKHDVSGLLAKHSEVERRHIKLWLTSTEVLDALLNSEVFNRSEDTLDQARHQLRLWVPNPSFTRAREILDTDRVCVISGAPGIGKTMLANVLAAGYASRQYQLVAISDDIDEGERSWRSNIRQVFLYDDFLGHVTYGELRLRKNEQSRLAQFMERVRRSEKKRFILTTREYILSEAMHHYERFSDMELTSSKSIISLEDYTQLIRGRILYNHLFFSDLPSNLKTALMPNERYWDVIRHQNYNPRVVEHAVRLPRGASLSPSEFVSSILATLDDPVKVWEVIFENLPEMARRVLLAVASLPTEVFLEDVQHVVRGLSDGDFTASRFKSAIGMIEGTFIDLREAKPGTNSRHRIVVIRDPSVRDYLWARLEAVEGEADALLKSAIFFEQCVILYEGRSHANAMRTTLLSGTRVQTRAREVVSHEEVVSQAISLIGSISPVVRRWRDEDSQFFKRESRSWERRTAFLVDVLVAHQSSQTVRASARLSLTATIKEWEQGRGSPIEALELRSQVKDTKGLFPEEYLKRVERALFRLITRQLFQKEGFEALVKLSILEPSFFAGPQRSLESWSSEFENFLEGERDWLLYELDNPDWLEEEIRVIGQLAAAFGIDVSKLEADAESRVEELRIEWEPDSEDDMPEFYSDSGIEAVEAVEAEIDALFQSLR